MSKLSRCRRHRRETHVQRKTSVPKEVESELAESVKQAGGNAVGAEDAV